MARRKNRLLCFGAGFFCLTLLFLQMFNGENNHDAKTTTEPSPFEVPDTVQPAATLAHVPVTTQHSDFFRLDLEWTEDELRAKEMHESVLQKFGHKAYLDLLADTPTPILPWKHTATPIVCDGMEYYSGHFSIPSENIVTQVPPKTQDWAIVIPGKMKTYVFKKEEEYRADLERSRFGITRRRYGFATNRNLEMLAAGCMPYFCGASRIPSIGTLDSLPKSFFKSVLQMPGVFATCFPPKKATTMPLVAGQFNETKYQILSRKLLTYTQQYQTTTHFAKYALSATSLKVLPKNVLLLWASHYTIMLTGFLHGLRRLGVRVEDVPRRPEVYKGPGCEEAREKTYAKGWFFFCKAEESEGLSRTNISARIRAKEFDLIIISITDTLTYHMKDPT